MCQKSFRTECALYELWVGEGLAVCVTMWQNIHGVYNCDLSSLHQLIFFPHAFVYMSSVSGCQAMSTEQRTNLKFLVRLGKTKTLSEALGMLQQVYGDETMSRSRVCEWYKRFKEGREDVKDDPRSGRLSTSRTEANVERVRQMVRGDRRLTVRRIANELGMNRNSVWKIITEDLGMRKVCAKMVPKLLNDDQKDRRMQVCQEGTICSCIWNISFVTSIITFWDMILLIGKMLKWH